MKVVAYYRVSTAQQGASGLGLEAQQASVESFAVSRDMTILDSFIEIESGAKGDREQLAKALRRCRHSGATLVVAKLDRLSRDIGAVDALQKSAVPFICVEHPTANSMTISILAVFAEEERRVISERTKAALAAAKARGVKLGGLARFGEKANNDTTAANATRSRAATKVNAEITEFMAEIEADAGTSMTLQALADALNAANYTTARGKTFTAATVHRIKKAVESKTVA